MSTSTLLPQNTSSPANPVSSYTPAVKSPAEDPSAGNQEGNAAFSDILAGQIKSPLVTSGPILLSKVISQSEPQCQPISLSLNPAQTTSVIPGNQTASVETLSPETISPQSPAATSQSGNGLLTLNGLIQLNQSTSLATAGAQTSLTNLKVANSTQEKSTSDPSESDSSLPEHISTPQKLSPGSGPKNKSSLAHSNLKLTIDSETNTEPALTTPSLVIPNLNPKQISPLPQANPGTNTKSKSENGSLTPVSPNSTPTPSDFGTNNLLQLFQAGLTPSAPINPAGPNATVATNIPDLQTIENTVPALKGKIVPGSSPSSKSKGEVKVDLSPSGSNLTSSPHPESAEKNSFGSNPSGTFLQAQADTSSATKSNSQGMVAEQPTATTSDVSQLMALFTPQNRAESQLPSHVVKELFQAGTVNAQKDISMKTATQLSDALSSGLLGNGQMSNSSVTTDSRPTISLHSNNEFESALKQVIQIAQVTPVNPPHAPQRLSIELQTPPGALVNVYVSHQNGQWRTQLSTDDPQALKWLQDKMPDLRQASEFNSEIRWLPPQMENGQGSSWNHQGQRHQQQQQPQPQKNPAPEEQEEATDFMTTIQKMRSGL